MDEQKKLEMAWELIRKNSLLKDAIEIVNGLESWLEGTSEESAATPFFEIDDSIGIWIKRDPENIFFVLEGEGESYLPGKCFAGNLESVSVLPASSSDYDHIIRFGFSAPDKKNYLLVGAFGTHGPTMWTRQLIYYIAQHPYTKLHLTFHWTDKGKRPSMMLNAMGTNDKVVGPGSNWKSLSLKDWKAPGNATFDDLIVLLEKCQARLGIDVSMPRPRSLSVHSEAALITSTSQHVDNEIRQPLVENIKSRIEEWGETGTQWLAWLFSLKSLESADVPTLKYLLEGQRLEAIGVVRKAIAKRREAGERQVDLPKLYPGFNFENLTKIEPRIEAGTALAKILESETIEYQGATHDF